MEPTPQNAPEPPAMDNSALHRDILTSLRRIIRAVDLYSHRLMEGHGLTGPQLAALQELDRSGTLSARDLSRAVQVSQPTVTGILDRLERRQLIARTRSDADRRALEITLTDEGRRVLKDAPPLLQQHFVAELARLETWEQTMILATLQRIAMMMDADKLQAAPLLVTGAELL